MHRSAAFEVGFELLPQIVGIGLLGFRLLFRAFSDGKLDFDEEDRADTRSIVPLHAPVKHAGRDHLALEFLAQRLLEDPRHDGHVLGGIRPLIDRFIPREGRSGQSQCARDPDHSYH